MNHPILTDEAKQGLTVMKQGDGMRSLSCSRCGETMSCGAQASSCWCQAFAALPAQVIDGQSDCMCASCLGKLHQELGTSQEPGAANPDLAGPKPPVAGNKPC